MLVSLVVIVACYVVLIVRFITIVLYIIMVERSVAQSACHVVIVVWYVVIVAYVVIIYVVIDVHIL